MKASDLRVGMTIRCKEHNECLTRDGLYIVQKSHGRFYVECAKGMHFIIDEDILNGKLIGWDSVP